MDELVIVNIENKYTVFSGRELGAKFRKDLKIDEFDKTPKRLLLVFPEDTDSISSGFFLNLFSESIKLLGEEKFRQKYTLVVNDAMHKEIEKYISSALKPLCLERNIY